MKSYRILGLTALACITLVEVGGQQAQNPSPMVEHTRRHPRLAQQEPAGRREKLEAGILFIPAKSLNRQTMPLFIHFHGSSWLPEVAVARLGKAAVISLQLGSGSGAYAKSFQDLELFGRILAQAEKVSGKVFSPLALTSWSAGYGAIREILRVPEYYRKTDRLLLIDGLHTGYLNGKPGPLESELETENLGIFLRFAQDAVAGKKQMILLHTEIFPGTFASTTETADYLLRKLGLQRIAVLRWGPMGSQQIGRAHQGKFQLLSFAGNSAPDHVDLLHSLPDLLRLFH